MTGRDEHAVTVSCHQYDLSAEEIPFDLLWKYVGAYLDDSASGDHGISHWIPSLTVVWKM